MLKLARKNKGYSLVEILIVVTIIGVLMTMFLPRIKGLFRRIADMRENRILQSWDSKIKEFYLDTGSYPDRITDLFVRPNNPRIASNWRGYAEDDNDRPYDSKGRDLIYNQPPILFGDLYKNYELYTTGEFDPDEATRDNITAKIGG